MGIAWELRGNRVRPGPQPTPAGAYLCLAVAGRAARAALGQVGGVLREAGGAVPRVLRLDGLGPDRSGLWLDGRDDPEVEVEVGPHVRSDRRPRSASA